jgi:uncharacterized protein (DUF58 family)
MDEGIDVTESRAATTTQPNDDGQAASAGRSSFDEINDLPLEMDLKRMMRQVPTKLHPLYGLHLGRSVLLLLIVLFLFGGMAFVTQLNLLFWAISLSVAMFFISILFPGWIVNSLEVTKIVPDTGFVSRPAAITYIVRNKRKLFPLYSIRIVELFSEEQVEGLPRAFIPCLGPGKTCSFQLYVTPRHRGALGCQGTRIASKYPFGLLTRFRTVVDCRHIEVYPALGTLTTRLMPAHKESEYQMGVSQPRNQGNSEEFFALREYRAGDNPRLIHWKRTARMGRLVVREMCQYAPRRFTVILDTHLPEDTPKNRLIFEEMVSFAATVLCQSLENGYRTALVCTSVPPTMVPPLTGRPAQQRILRTLSVIEPQFEHRLPELFESWRFNGSWSGRCLVVGRGNPGTGLLARLSEVVGPVQYLQAGSGEWRNIFVPPAYLREERGRDDV